MQRVNLLAEHGARIAILGAFVGVPLLGVAITVASTTVYAGAPAMLWLGAGPRAEHRPPASTQRIVVSRRYTVQVGAFRRRPGAEGMLARVDALYQDGRIVVARLDDSLLWRVVSGVFATEGEARARAIALDERGFSTYVRVLTGMVVPEEVSEPEAEEQHVALAPTPPQPLVAKFGAQAAEDRAATLTRRPEERRPEKQLTTELFGRQLTIGGEYEIEPRYRQDFALGSKDDDVFRLDQKAQLEFFYRVSRNATIFVEGKGAHRDELYAEGGKRTSSGSIERGETWLYVGDLGGFQLQVGRQNFRDRRKWWWGRDLDAARVYYEHASLSVEMAVGQRLGPLSTTEARVNPEEEDVTRLLSHATWKWGKRQRVEAFALYQNDHSRTPNVGDRLRQTREDAVDANMLWAGVASRGRWKPRSGFKFYYWLDAAAAVGDETVIDFTDVGPVRSEVADRLSHDVRGWAVDAGTTWQTKWPWRPRLTVGYAIGSGDRRADGSTDHAFRQTGLQGNKDRFRGVDTFLYYGELLRPELSNLQIGTFSLGLPLLHNSSVELVYHVYRQVRPAPFMRDTRIKVSPLGKNRSIGQEFDLILGLEEWRHWQVEFVAALFRAGGAYGDLAGDTASNLRLQIDYNF